MKMDAKTLEKLSKKNLKTFLNNKYQIATEFRLKNDEFFARQVGKWNGAFAMSETLYQLVFETSEHYRNDVGKLDEQEKNDKKFLYLTLLHLHARAMHQFFEILTLMKNGFADGAYARYRSLYELTAISYFIKKYGEKVAEAYIESQDSDNYEWAKVSGKFKNYERDNRNITIDAIATAGGLKTDQWTEIYDLASKVIHPSADGTFNRIGNMNNEKITIGPTDYGIVDPATNSAVSLLQMTSIFFGIFPNDNSMVATVCIGGFVAELVDTYYEAHNRIFPDDQIMDKNSVKKRR